MLICLLVVAALVVPVGLGVLLRAEFRKVAAELLALFASTIFLYRAEYLPGLPAAVRVRGTVKALLNQPFLHYGTFWAVLLLLSATLGRILLPYLLARMGIEVVDLWRARRLFRLLRKPHPVGPPPPSEYA